MNESDFMRLALEQALNSSHNQDVPVGAVVVDENGNILAAAGNRRVQDNDPSAHAEIVALKEAGKKHGHWNLSGCTLYITLEPCPMCAGAAVQARIKKIVYGASDAKAGVVSLNIPILDNAKLNHRVLIEGGILAGESVALLQDFFRARRS